MRTVSRSLHKSAGGRAKIAATTSNPQTSKRPKASVLIAGYGKMPENAQHHKLTVFADYVKTVYGSAHGVNLSYNTKTRRINLAVGCVWDESPGGEDTDSADIDLTVEQANTLAHAIRDLIRHLHRTNKGETHHA